MRRAGIRCHALVPNAGHPRAILNSAELCTYIKHIRPLVASLGATVLIPARNHDVGSSNPCREGFSHANIYSFKPVLCACILYDSAVVKLYYTCRIVYDTDLYAYNVYCTVTSV